MANGSTIDPIGGIGDDRLLGPGAARGSTETQLEQFVERLRRRQRGHGSTGRRPEKDFDNIDRLKKALRKLEADMQPDAFSRFLSELENSIEYVIKTVAGKPLRVGFHEIVGLMEDFGMGFEAELTHEVLAALFTVLQDEIEVDFTEPTANGKGRRELGEDEILVKQFIDGAGWNKTGKDSHKATVDEMKSKLSNEQRQTVDRLQTLFADGIVDAVNNAHTDPKTGLDEVGRNILLANLGHQLGKRFHKKGFDSPELMQKYLNSILPKHYRPNVDPETLRQLNGNPPTNVTGSHANRATKNPDQGQGRN